MTMRLLPILAALGILAGCGPKPWRGDVVVSLDPGLRGADGRWPVLEMDLIGTSQGDAARWQAVPVQAYFDPGSQARASAPRVTIWFDGDHPVATLKKDDVTWDGWGKAHADTLVVFADLLALERPTATPGQPPPPAVADERRLVLSLMDDKVPLDRAGRLVLLANARGIQPAPDERASNGTAGAKGGSAQTRTAGADEDGRTDAPKVSPIRRAGSSDPVPENTQPAPAPRRAQER
jgi:hypothetical protein